MSPQEFSMRIFNTRSKGDFSLAYEVRDYRCSLTGEFELDPSLLLQILRDFGAFIGDE
jgi:hypothetical protein